VELTGIFPAVADVVAETEMTGMQNRFRFHKAVTDDSSFAETDADLGKLLRPIQRKIPGTPKNPGERFSLIISRSGTDRQQTEQHGYPRYENDYGSPSQLPAPER